MGLEELFIGDCQHAPGVKIAGNREALDLGSDKGGVY